MAKRKGINTKIRYRDSGTKGSKVKYLLLGIILIPLIIFLIPKKQEASEDGNTNVNINQNEPDETEEEPKKINKDRTELKTSIQSIIDNTIGTYGYYVYEMDTDVSFGANEDIQFVAASTNKLPMLVKLYQELEKGNIQKDELWTYKGSDYESGTGSLQYKSVGTKYTVETLATKMIHESDNVATNIVIRNLGRANVQAMLDGLGLSSIDMVQNLATPKAMSQVLIKTYLNELTTGSSTTEMLGLMTNTLFENRLPSLLDDEVDVAHKIGTQAGAISDAGIVFLEGSPFIISVYSKNVTSVAEAESVIGQIAKEVYDFEKNR